MIRITQIANFILNLATEWLLQRVVCCCSHSHIIHWEKHISSYAYCNFDYELLLKTIALVQVFYIGHERYNNIARAVDRSQVFIYNMRDKDVKNILKFFIFYFINKKRWAFLFLFLTTTFSSLVHIQINCTCTLYPAHAWSDSVTV